MNDLAEKLLAEYQSLVSFDPESADTINQSKYMELNFTHSIRRVRINIISEGGHGRAQW